MVKSTLLAIIIMTCYCSNAQTWSDDVAQIVYDKCTKCHHNGGVAPFPLMTYAETSPMASAMAVAISGDVMPPWPPDNSFQNYAHDRSLSATEKTTILDWITNGTPEGTPGNTPPPPVYNIGSIYGAGDLTIQIPTYMSKATVEDDYVCFALPTNLPVDRDIMAIEIVPGNPATVHHALIYIDPTGGSVTDTVGGDCGGPGSSADLVMGYTPGSIPLVLPTVAPLKLGMTMPANSQVIFALHYPAGSYGTYDSTKVIFHFYPPGEPGVRQVFTSPVLQNWIFGLAPNQVTSLSAQYPASGGLPWDFSILTVFPHMHLLGQSMKVYGIQPNLDTLKLINIPDWDFDWQGYYFLKNIQKAQLGSYLKVDAVYDNTSANPYNPNVPPAWVFSGLNTTDEMLLVYMHYMIYQAGDENYDMDSLLNLSSLSLMEEEFGETMLSIYPNPFSDELVIYSDKYKAGDLVTIHVYDSKGALVSRIVSNMKLESNEINIKWDGKNEDGSSANAGLYFISSNVNGIMSHQRVIKR